MNVEEPRSNTHADELAAIREDFTKRISVMTGALDTLQRTIVNHQHFTSVTTGIEQRLHTLKSEIDALVSAEDRMSTLAKGLAALQDDVNKRFSVMTGTLDLVQKNVVNHEHFTLVTGGIEERLHTIKKEVDALQIEVMQPAKPWYRQPSLMISIIAVLFSMGTFIISFNQTRAQDRRAARGELRQLIQRMIALPRENLELAKTHEKDPVTSNLLAGLVNQEYSVLARQGAEILERVSGEATAREYQSVAQALADSNNPEMAGPLIEKGLLVSKDYSSELELLRLYGAVLMNSGNLDHGRAKYQDALNLNNKYSLNNEFFIFSSKAITEMNWALAELGQGQCSEARRHLSQAKESLNKIQFTPPLVERLKQQAVSYEDLIQKNTQGCRN